PPDRREPLRREERLAETDFRADTARRDLAAGAEEQTGKGIGDVIARVANAGQRERRQAHLRKRPVDQASIGRIDLLVEELRALQLIAAGDADTLRQALAELRTERPSCEVEARTSLLLERAGEVGVRGRAEGARLAEGADDAVLDDVARA